MSEAANNPGLADQCYHMAHAAVEALGLSFEHTSPSQIKKAIEKLDSEYTDAADKLSDCWLWIDRIARLGEGPVDIDIIRKSASCLLRKQKTPGWKS